MFIKYANKRNRNVNSREDASKINIKQLFSKVINCLYDDISVVVFCKVFQMATLRQGFHLSLCENYMNITYFTRNISFKIVFRIYTLYNVPSAHLKKMDTHFLIKS